MRGQSKVSRFFIGHLDDHKLQVEYSATNEMIYPPAKKYPKNRWMTVIATSHIHPQEELMRELKKLSKYFMRLHGTTLKPSPDQRWRNYSLDSGQNRVIEV